MSKIAINNVSKVFESKGAMFKSLDNISFNVNEGEFLCILGPSGCGKSTILRLMAGLDKPSSGQILMDNEVIIGPDCKCGMVFQEYSLFPWRSVIENVAFPLEMKGVAEEERYKIAEDYLKIVGLQNFRDSMPHELSGGMKQRVAIVRSLAGDPDVLLMDEPFGALDIQTRNQLQKDLLKVWEDKGKTIVFVTHDIDEAIFLGDRVILMSKGPGRIARIFKVNIKRIRDTLTPDFLHLKQEIMGLLESGE
ncbi:MAG TPA: ABC transporter ATP-binding protein [Methanobacterium sp.]|nr:ABC transporter ATP-binding protein [Methanobacterium sp.]